MAHMEISHDDRREVEALIPRRCNLQDGLERRKLLADADIEEVGGGVNWDAPPDTFAWQLVRVLQDHGTLESTGQPALASLLRELRRRSRGHESDAAFLDRLLAPYGPAPDGRSGPGPAQVEADARLVLAHLAGVQSATEAEIMEATKLTEERFGAADGYLLDRRLVKQVLRRRLITDLGRSGAVGMPRTGG